MKVELGARTNAHPDHRPHLSAAGTSHKRGDRRGAGGDPAALADAIMTLHDDPATTREMGARARRVARQFDRRIAVQAYHELFERVAGIERAA